MQTDELDALEAVAQQAHSIVVIPRDTMMLSTGKLLEMIADLRRAQETIDAIEDFVVAHYLDTQMGRRVLALIDPATYDEGKTDE